MTCSVCSVIKQITLNLLLAFDQFANALLLGDPNETISRRTARARNSGEAWAKALCSVLNIISKDHCTWALTPGPSIGAEVLHLSQPPPPRVIVE